MLAPGTLPRAVAPAIPGTILDTDYRLREEAGGSATSPAMLPRSRSSPPAEATLPHPRFPEVPPSEVTRACSRRRPS